jgi:hypothetical protein
VYYYDRCNLKDIRKGQWKLVFPSISQTYKRTIAIGNNGWPGMYASESVNMALYDLRTNAGETLDVQTKYPKIMNELMVIADRYRVAIGDDLTKQKGNEVRTATRVILADVE